MKFTTYLKDKYIYLITCIFVLILITILLFIFNTNIFLTILIITLYLISYFIPIIYDYNKRKSFYNYITKKLLELDKKYLITELLKEPNFLEGKLLIDYLYDIDKSYIEDINKYKYITEEFIEYIELWCHEIKTPIATTKLIIDNHKNETTDSIKEEITKLENYVEQVLFYARSDTLEKDYLITKVNLKEILETIIKNNKKDLINKHIKIEMFKEDIYIESDTKWLTFILNQIITNSIKYINDNPKIEITYKKNNNNIILNIIDNGIGIKNEEIERVFDKGFTGSNGRKIYSSTGLGLYLSKKLCHKLGHNINITSKLNEYTKVMIVFPINSLPIN